MAQSADHFIKLLVGDLAARLAQALAEVDRLTELLAAAPPKPRPKKES